jgi:hypothetical protein
MRTPSLSVIAIARTLGGLLLAAGSAYAQTSAEAPSPVQARDGELRVIAFLTDDDAKVRSEWKASTSMPQFQTVNTARAGDRISTVLVFEGCAAGALGKCDLAARFVLHTPDGQRIDAGSGPVWNVEPTADRLMLGAARARVQVQANWPPGKFAFHVTVVDRIASRTLELRLPFVVVVK